MLADDVEVVKSVAAEELVKDGGEDQVALETVDQEPHIHAPPPNFIQSEFHIVPETRSSYIYC